jgi:predicted Zn-dependent peptidase
VFQFQDQVRQTTAAEVLAAAQDRLRPEQLVILVVGSPTEIQPSLDTLDPNTTVNAVDITIPQA